MAEWSIISTSHYISSTGTISCIRMQYVLVKKLAGNAHSIALCQSVIHNRCGIRVMGYTFLRRVNCIFLE